MTSRRFTLDSLSPKQRAEAERQLGGPSLGGQKAGKVIIDALWQVAGTFPAPKPSECVKSEKKGKGGPRVPRTRNGGKWTDAQYFQRVRWALRETFRWWGPAMAAKKAAKVGSGKNARWLCAGCGKLFREKEIQVDHKEPAGALTDYAHIADFLRRLTPEDPNAFQVLCKGMCHRHKTATERKTGTPVNPECRFAGASTMRPAS